MNNIKFKVSSDVMYNEEAVNTIIKNYVEKILEGTLADKQTFLVSNGLAKIIKENKCSCPCHPWDQNSNLPGKEDICCINCSERKMNQKYT